MSVTRRDFPSSEDEIDLLELFKIVWDGKLLIIAFAVLAAVASVGLALSMPNVYTSTAVLAPKSGGSNGLSRLASQYGGLASLAGINLGGIGTEGLSKSSIALEKIKSFSFFKQHLYEDFVVDLMAVKAWHSNVRELEYDPEVFDATIQKWTRAAAKGRQAKPSDQEAHKVFLPSLSVSEDKKSGLIRVSVEHQSPDVAKRWVEMIITRVSEDLRAKDIREAKESIKFLEAQREKTSLVSLDEIFAQLIEEQTKTIMLANVSKDYIFDVIDQPVAPELKSKPSRTLVCVLGTMLGGILGVAFVFFRHYRGDR